MACPAQPTDRSPGLLLSFPQEILQSILYDFLMNELYTDKFVTQELSCRVLPFGQIVRETKNIRGVCSSWANATRSLVSRGKSTRDGLVLKLPCLLSEEDLRTFPSLRDCMVELCHPYSLPQLDCLQQDLEKSSVDSLRYVCAVTWKYPGRRDLYSDRNWVGYMVYRQNMVDTFTDKWFATGQKKIAGCCATGGSSVDSEQVNEAAVRAMNDFIFKEVLALWYYNAHIVRQILSAFPLLEYLVLPDFLHLPLLTKEEYFFPACTDSDESSPSGPVNLSPPQILETMGITYTETGRRYSDIMASVKAVDFFTNHVNPILSLLSHLPVSLRAFNGWFSEDCGEGERNILNRLRKHIDKAVSDIPDTMKPMLLCVGHLRNVMYVYGYGPNVSGCEKPCRGIGLTRQKTYI